MAAGAEVIVTSGAAQSNHARLTAAAAARVGMESVLVLSGPPQPANSGNLALDALFGAHLEWTGDLPPGADADEVLAAAVDEVAARLRQQGRRVFVIPFGGSSAESARGYQLAAAEILDQLPEVAHVVVAVGSGGTAAGLVAGLGPQRVLGVHTGAVGDPRTTLARLLTDMPDVDVDADSLRIREDQVGDGYDAVVPAAAQAIETAARSEGLILDPIYTGRALAGLAAAIRDGDMAPDAPTVFVHTGGLPGFFGHYTALESALYAHRG